MLLWQRISKQAGEWLWKKGCQSSWRGKRKRGGDVDGRKMKGNLLLVGRGKGDKAVGGREGKMLLQDGRKRAVRVYLVISCML